AILFAQLRDRSEVQRAVGAPGHAGGLFTGIDQVGAERALRHHTAIFVELRRAVRAGPLAVAAADAFVRVDQHDTIVAALNGRRRADIHAQRVFAMHARRRDIVGEDVVGKVLISVLDPLATGVFGHTTPHDADGQIVLILARDLAGFAAGAFREIDVKP